MHLNLLIIILLTFIDLLNIYAQPKIKSMQRQTINPRSASKSPKIASVTTTFTSVFSTFMLLLLLSVATINAQENCYINESGFTCCSKSLGKCYSLFLILHLENLCFIRKFLSGDFEFWNSERSHFHPGRNYWSFSIQYTFFLLCFTFTCKSVVLLFFYLFLESAMKSAMTGGDLLGAADSIQKMAEGMLGGKFESVVSLDDFAHKHHFKVCKFQEIKSMQIK